MEYLRYLSKPIPESSSGISYMPTFYRDTIVMTLSFSVMYILVPLIAKICYNDWYYKLDKKKREDFPSYFVCLFHHFLLVPRSWYHVIVDFNRVNNSNIDYGAIEVIVAPICLGYLISDTIFYAINEVFTHNKFDYVLHHICTVILVMFTILANDGSICKFIPLLLLCDTTNIFFNCAWIMRLIPKYRESFMVKTLEMCFLISFLLLRTIHMPCLFYAIAVTKAQYLGFAKHMLLPIALVQWYWTYLVLIGSLKRFLPPKKSDSKSK